MNTVYEEYIVQELGLNELETVSGGHPFEESFGDINLYRAGVSYVNVCFGDDEYYVGSTRISKDLAKALRERSMAFWKAGYAATGDYVQYARAWKQILANEYGIAWDGLMGSYSHSWT